MARRFFSECFRETVNEVTRAAGRSGFGGGSVRLAVLVVAFVSFLYKAGVFLVKTCWLLFGANCKHDGLYWLLFVFFDQKHVVLLSFLCAGVLVLLCRSFQGFGMLYIDVVGVV